jgi:hypothetical protein
LRVLQDRSRHPQVRGIDHPAFVRRRALARRHGRIVRLHQRSSARNVLLAWREYRVRRSELRRVDALFAVEPERACDATRSLEADRILEGTVWAIHAAETMRSRSGDDRVHDRVPAVTGVEFIVLVVLADAR